MKNTITRMLTEYWEDFTSMEQLWLAFVMYERYQKVWDSEKEEWVKCEES